MSEEVPAIDWEQMDMIADGYAPEFMDIFHEFTSEIPALLDELTALKPVGDLQAARKVAHQIKGSAANFGFCGLSSAAASIEMAAKSGSWDSFESSLERARGGFSRGIEEFRAKHGGV